MGDCLTMQYAEEGKLRSRCPRLRLDASKKKGAEVDCSNLEILASIESPIIKIFYIKAQKRKSCSFLIIPFFQ